jgi:signal transduction histidine kinase
LIQALQKLVERPNIPRRLRCDFHSTGVPEESLPPSVQEDLLRIAQEAMSNAVRHAKPTVISVSLRCDPPNLVLEVTDNGSGIANPEAACREGFGLSSMQARAENLGANLTFELPRVLAQASSFAYGCIQELSRCTSLLASNQREWPYRAMDIAVKR